MKVNPYLFARKLSGMSQKEFCVAFDFAKQTIISVEQGVYADVSPRMEHAIFQACAIQNVTGVQLASLLGDEYGTRSLAFAYTRWQKEARAEVSQLIANYNPTMWTDTRSPLSFFMHQTAGSVQGFAKAVKVQSSTLQRYATGAQAQMPTTLRAALIDMNYQHADRLVKVQTDWIEQYA